MKKKKRALTQDVVVYDLTLFAPALMLNRFGKPLEGVRRYEKSFYQNGDVVTVLELA